MAVRYENVTGIMGQPAVRSRHPRTAGQSQLLCTGPVEHDGSTSTLSSRTSSGLGV